ncbi:MAG: hypothetical protein NVV57_04475 [Demequina sp.]|nr:hypothetical protein [Demequina sp.]
MYPMVFTGIRSFYNAKGDKFIGWDNYVTMFTRDSTFTAIRNNIIWVIVAPISCTLIGLVFAVLLDKIRWSTAFKLIIFMPMAISMLAAGVIFRGMFQEDPSIGVVNAAIVGAKSVFSNQSAYPGAKPRTDAGIIAEQGIIATESTVTPGSTADFPLVGIRTESLGEDPTQAAPASGPADGEVTGTVWLDFVRGGGGVPGSIDDGEMGLPGVRVDAVAADGSVAASAQTADDGTYVIQGLDAGASYRIALPPRTSPRAPRACPGSAPLSSRRWSSSPISGSGRGSRW